MSAQANAPVIIKRVRKCGEPEAHGGAWKVAYADFVTAMMAFFMLMWLLNATTEKQRKGIADYFSPTIPIMRTSGGGNGAFGGDSVYSEEMLAQNGSGGMPSEASAADSAGDAAAQAAEAQALQQIEEILTARSGDSMVSDLAQRHIVTELTDEGLLVEIYDLDGEPLFVDGGTEPTQLMSDIVSMLARVFDLLTNGIAVDGFVAAEPVVLIDNPNWELSASRADQVRRMLESAGVDPTRIKRVTGHADRQPAVRNTMAVRNNRVELVVLRSKR